MRYFTCRHRKEKKGNFTAYIRSPVTLSLNPTVTIARETLDKSDIPGIEQTVRSICKRGFRMGGFGWYNKVYRPLSNAVQFDIQKAERQSRKYHAYALWGRAVVFFNPLEKITIRPSTGTVSPMKTEDKSKICCKLKYMPTKHRPRSTSCPDWSTRDATGKPIKYICRCIWRNISAGIRSWTGPLKSIAKT